MTNLMMNPMMTNPIRKWTRTRITNLIIIMSRLLRIPSQLLRILRQLLEMRRFNNVAKDDYQDCTIRYGLQ
jgi:hypothetical protein